MYRKRTSKPREVDYERPLYLDNFSVILPSIEALHPSKPISAQYLAHIVFQLLSFMDAYLGKESAKPYKLTKIPCKLFRSFESQGSLHHILNVSLQYAQSLHWGKFDILRPDRLEHGYELLIHIKNMLVEKKFMELPKVFLENVPLTTKSELSTIVQSHGGSVVENIDDASHVVEWNEEMDTTNEENNDRVEYARPVEIRSDALILLHFWQYPDHYDEWFSSDDIEGIDLLEIANSVNRTKWHVSAKFIKDCEIFNEWGNELDYEIENESTTDIDEENLIDQKPLSKKVRKAKGNRGYDFLSLKKDQMIEEAVTVTDKLLTDIPPASTTSKSHNVYDISVDPQSSFLTTVNGAEKRKSNEALDNIEEQSKRLKSSKNSSSSQLKSPLKYPDWFKSDVISSMECRYMPQLLQSSSKSNISEYIRIRQQIILIDSQNPNFYLSATESRQKIIGDVGMIIATHEFLDAFNIINQGVKPESRPTPSFSIFSSTHEQPIINKFDHDDIDLQLLIKVAEIGNDWSNVSSSLRSKNIDLSPHECLNRFLALANLNDLLDSAKIKSESTPGNTDKRADTSYMSSLLVRKIETEVAAKAMENEYLELRLSILEDKMKLVSNIHSILHEDRERLEIERRDLIIQKAQNAFNQRSKS